MTKSTPTKKESNPKDSCGVKKVPFSTIPQAPLGELGLALLEGGRKYGRHNYRVVKVKSSTYYDAYWRHTSAWWEGEDIDPESGIHHLSKAMACLVILRDAEINGLLEDDRPPKLESGWQQRMAPVIESLFERLPDCEPAYTELTKKE